MSIPSDLLEEFKANRDKILHELKFLSTSDRLDRLEQDVANNTQMILGNSVIIDQIKDLLIGLLGTGEVKQ